MANSHESEALRAQPAPDEQAAGQRDTLLRVIQTLNQNPYSLTKSECIEVVREMMDAAPHPPAQRAQAEAVATLHDGQALAMQPKPVVNTVPGKVHCAKCGFTLNRVNLYVLSGTTGPGGEQVEPCPNDGNPMLPVTWEQEARDAWKAGEQLLERAVAAENALAAGKADVPHLYQHALTELQLLGYTVEDGDLVPPPDGIPVRQGTAGQPQRGAGEGLVPKLTDEQRIDYLCDAAVYTCGQWQVVIESDNPSFIDAFDEHAERAHGIRPAGSEGEAS